MSDRNPFVLLIEDDDLDRDLFTRAFRQSGVSWDLQILTDGDMASDFLHSEGQYRGRQNLPDLIFMDLNLPRKAGRQLLIEAKQNARLRQIPILIYSGTENGRDIIDSLGQHANAFIKKPVFLEEMIKLIQCTNEFWFSSCGIMTHREYLNEFIS